MNDRRELLKYSGSTPGRQAERKKRSYAIVQKPSVPHGFATFIDRGWGWGGMRAMVRQRRRVPLAYLGVADARGVAVLEQLAALEHARVPQL